MLKDENVLSQQVLIVCNSQRVTGKGKSIITEAYWNTRTNDNVWGERWIGPLWRAAGCSISTGNNIIWPS